ncbi:hypothetical protein [Streptomyces sp. NPDC056061]|uniref:hypothetical protein n=1 Tax=Streptomyces sp. NPDC056061 TaxID=3345700 RepID=UPI0035D6B75A
MRTPARIRRRGGAFRARAGAALAALMLLGGAGTAVADGPGTTPTPTATATATATAASKAADGASRPERLAEELRKNPVYVSADRPRRLPRSLAPDIAALAARTGVPTYVLALPAGDDTLLALVHDRLGKTGLYVLISEYSSIHAAAFGVDVPVEEAGRVALYGTPYGAGPLAAFESFVDAIASGHDRAAAEADKLYERYRKDGKPEEYISSTDRQNQNLLLGLAVVVIPGLVLALGTWFALHRSRPAGKADLKRVAGPRNRSVSLDKSASKNSDKGAGKTPGKGSDTGSGKAAVRPQAPPRARFAARRRGVLPVTVVATAAAVVAVVQLAPSVFPQTVDGPYLRITEGDLDARVEEVAAGLAAGPIYQDLSTAEMLNGADLPVIHRRLAELEPEGPVYVLVTTSNTDDESGGDQDILLARVHQRTGRNGVYVLIDPVSGRIAMNTFGTDHDTVGRFMRLPSSVIYPEYRRDGDMQVVPRLDKALDAVAEAEPSKGYDPAIRETELPPLHDNRLPSLFTSDFGPGVALGTLLLCVLLPVIWLVLALIRLLLRSRRTAAVEPSPPQHVGPRHAAALPSVRQLRAWAAADVRELTGRLAATAQDTPGRTRAWDCLDAAELLAGAGDGHPDRAAGAGDLAAVAVLARAGLAALRGQLHPTVCRLNPLHGEATGGRVPGWLVDRGIGPGSARLCPACRDAVRSSGVSRGTADAAARERVVSERLLSLPGADGRTRIAWNEAGQVLPGAREGLEALILRARESAGVQ